jgi:hypothetical protein
LLYYLFFVAVIGSTINVSVSSTNGTLNDARRNVLRHLPASVANTWNGIGCFGRSRTDNGKCLSYGHDDTRKGGALNPKALYTSKVIWISAIY